MRRETQALETLDTNNARKSEASITAEEGSESQNKRAGLLKLCFRGTISTAVYASLAERRPRSGESVKYFSMYKTRE